MTAMELGSRHKNGAADNPADTIVRTNDGAILSPSSCTAGFLTLIKWNFESRAPRVNVIVPHWFLPRVIMIMTVIILCFLSTDIPGTY